MMNLASFVILAAAIAGASAQVMVNTPTSVVACLPVQLTWSGGAQPYFVSILPGGQPSATPLEDFGQQTGNSYVWKVDLPAKTSCTVQIRDSQGQLNYSDTFTIQPGSATCTPSSGSGATSTTSSTPATSTGTAAATPATKSPTSTTTTGSTGSAANATTSTPKTTTGSTTGSTTGTSAGTSTNGTSASTDARSDASRTSAGVLAVAVACVVAVFA